MVSTRVNSLGLVYSVCTFPRSSGLSLVLVPGRSLTFALSHLCMSKVKSLEGKILEGENQFCPLTSALRHAHTVKGWLQVLWLLLLHPVLRINAVRSLLLLKLIFYDVLLFWFF